MKKIIGSAVAALLTFSASTPCEARELASSFVLVGVPGNPADPETGCGAVKSVYAIQRAEVSNSEYAEFLTAVASDADPFALYSPLMEQHFFGGIARERAGGGYRYQVKPGYEQLPVTFVSWYSAARFANWMHYGRPTQVPGETGATEGDDKTGAYDTRAFPPASEAAAVPPVTRNTGARYWLPSCDEWVKAGFFDPSTGRYTEFADKAGVPLAKVPLGKDGAATATYFANAWAAPFPHLTAVGTHAGTPSPFGTYDQMGNVAEWLETSNGPAGRMVRGGSVFMGLNAMKRTYFDLERPEKRLSTFGFRLARRADVEQGAASPSSVARVGASSGVSYSSLPAPAAGPRYKTMQIGGTALKLLPVDQPYNPPDPLYDLGRVEYRFLIGETEITNFQYAAFLNAVASRSDEHCLYKSGMMSGVVGGIERRSERGRFAYSAKAGWERRPVTYVSWYDAARFVNWLEFGQPSPGRALLGSTEGDSTHGAYDTRYFGDSCGSDHSAWNLQPEHRNRHAHFALPTASEWHKAAYYDPQKYGRRPYWNYPTRSDDPPVAGEPPGSRATANYQAEETLGAGAPYFVSEVGAYLQVKSYFGTLDQGGNLWEWTEDWRSRGQGGCWRCDEWSRGLRGGSFNYTYIGLHAANTDPGAPGQAYPFYGFRIVAAVGPEGFVRESRSLRALLKDELWGTFRHQQGLVIFAFAGGIGCLLVGVATGLGLHSRKRKQESPAR